MCSDPSKFNCGWIVNYAKTQKYCDVVWNLIFVSQALQRSYEAEIWLKNYKSKSQNIKLLTKESLKTTPQIFCALLKQSTFFCSDNEKISSIEGDK